MKKIAKLSYMALILSAFMLFSCGKDDDTAGPDPNNPAAKNCILTGVQSIDGTDTYEAILEYNGQRQLTKVSNKANGVPESYFLLVEYNSDGRISKSTDMDGSVVEGYSTYAYNSDGLLIRREQYYSDTTGGPVVPYAFYTYEYNGNKKTSRVNRFLPSQPMVVESYSVYTYPGGNTATEKRYDSQGSGSVPTLSSSTNFTFDDKKNLQSLLGALVEDVFMSEHNILREDHFDANGNPIPGYVSTYTYEYNAEGFPTKETNMSGSSGPYVTNYTYNCN